MANPLQFAQQVRAEMSKVTWPTRREVVLTTGMVLLMAALASVFFFLTDKLIQMVLIWTVGLSS
jgi:preprotein translocase subunit SecE